MEIWDSILKPQVIGPLIGLAAVVGAFVVKGMNSYFTHQERLAKIANGIDPDLEEES